jgi:hypothetical protein
VLTRISFQNWFGNSSNEKSHAVRQKDLRRGAKQNDKHRRVPVAKPVVAPKSAEFVDTSADSLVDVDDGRKLAVAEILDATVTKLKALSAQMDDSSGDSDDLSIPSTDTSTSDSSSSDDGMLGFVSSVVLNTKFQKKNKLMKQLFGSPPATSPTATISTTSPISPTKESGNALLYFAGAEDDSDDDDDAEFSTPPHSNDDSF